MLLRDRFIIFASNIGCYLRHPILLLKFRRRLGRWPWPARPADYWNKILWRKLFDRNPDFTRFSDKLLYKSWIGSRYPGIRTAAVLWTGTVASDIPFEAFVGRPVVLKPNHGSRHSIFFVNQTTKDHQAVLRTAERWLNESHGWRTGEWGYGGVQRKLFVEVEIVAPPGSETVDCNCFCAMGRFIYCRVILDIGTPDERTAFFDRDGRRLTGTSLGKLGAKSPLPDDFRLPEAYFVAVSAAEEISQDMDFVRIDFLVAEEEIYALECTWYPGAGYTQYSDAAIPRAFHEAWDIRHSWFMTSTGHRLMETYKSALRRCL